MRCTVISAVQKHALSAARGRSAPHPPLGFILLAAAIGLAGCAEFRTYRLPEVARGSLVKSKVESVDYTLLLRFEIVGDQAQAVDSIVLVTEMHDVFTKVQHGSTGAPLHIDYVFGAPPISRGENVYMNLAGLTLFVVPFRHEVLYQLDAQVSWKGKPFRSYRYEDSQVLWAGLLLLPVWPFSPGKGETEVAILRNMQRTFLVDLGKDLETLDVRVAAETHVGGPQTRPARLGLPSTRRSTAATAPEGL